MSPAHHAGGRRWLVLVVVAAVFVGLALAARAPGKSAPGGPPPSPAALVGAASAESSAWYCTGQTTVAGALAPGSVILTNTTARAVSGTIDGVTDSGARVATAVSVPARGQTVATVPTPASGTWLSEVVLLSRGGVAVTQALRGPSGWAEAPCQSSTSPQWYFPSGATTGSDAMFVVLFNPTSTPDVIDLTFATAKGVVHPINFQGLVLQPGQTQVESVGVYVQEQPSIATTVTTRIGRVVASELELFSADGSGLAIVPGSPQPQQEWAIPLSVEIPGGSSSIDVFNPGPTAQEVTVRTRLASGPLSPFRARVPPQSTWVLSTSAQTRIPSGDPYGAVIDARGGAGVVVGRIVAAPATALAPQSGMTDAVDGLSFATPTREWLVPSPVSASLDGTVPDSLDLLNLSGRSETYAVAVMRPTGSRTLESGQIPAATSLSLSAPALARAGLDPLLVHASGPAAVSEDVGPTGVFGVVTMPGIPLSSPSGG